jgi:Flp pilus assembly protein TadD, contains TPR repeats
MVINDEEYLTLIESLKAKLKSKMDNIVFLELSRDLDLKSDLVLRSGTLLPVMSEDLVSGIKDKCYMESIPARNFVKAMIFTIGCDSEFKLNSLYINILKKVDSNIESIILQMGLNYLDKNEYMNALACFYTLERISGKLMETSYNIFNSLRGLAKKTQEEGRDEEYKLYYKLSYFQLKELSSDFPDFFYGHYHLGFYYMDMEMFDMSRNEWEKALHLAQSEQLTGEVQGLLSGIDERLDFEEGKNNIINGDSLDGLRKLIPLIDKHNEWSEAKYYTALGYRKIGNFIKAKMLLKELLDSGEDFSEIYSELGLCCYNLGDSSEAVRNFEEAVRNKPYEVGYICNLGMAYWAVGDKEKANECIEKAHNLKPDDQIVLDCRRWITKQR